MKPITKTLLCSALCASMALPLAACGEGGGNADGDKTTITISVYSAGYGTGWIEEACRIYEEDHDDVTFSIKANSRMFETNKTQLETNTCKSDVVLIANANYTSLAARGVFEDLTDLYDMVIPDTENTKVKDIIPTIQYEYRVRGDKIYGVPWQDNYCSGFIYNKKMFRDNGWEIPTTMDEFFDLCGEIAETGVAPLTFGGGQQNGYITGFLNQWFVEYYGYDYIANTFMKYETPEIYNETTAGRQKVYETAAKLIQGKTASGKSIVLDGSRGLTTQSAQREFIQGHAAMDVCGNWFPTEMTTYLKGYPDFEFGYMPVPHINADKKDYKGNDSSNVRYSLDGNVLCVPASSQHKEIAKDFLLSMYTQESYQTFVEENNGVLRPANIAVDASKLNDFAKASYEFFYAGKAADEYIYECSLSPMAQNGYLALLISQNGNTVNNLFNAANYEAALTVAATAAADDYTRALAMWDPANKKWKDSYLGVQ